jgi:hypothetical protein
MQLARPIATGMIVVALAVGCADDPSTPTPEARPPTVAATSTPEPAHTVPPRPTRTPPPSIEHIAPLDETADPETAEAGLLVLDLEAGTSWRSVGEPHAQPIRFEGETLVARIGDDIVRLDRAGEVVETLPGVGVTPGTNVNAPGLRAIDHHTSPDLRYRIERIDTRTATGSGLSQPFYDLVLLDLEQGTRTTVMHDQLLCQCDALPFGAWSDDGRYIDYGVDRKVMVDAPEATASIVLGDARVSWSPRGELFGVGSHGISIDGSHVLDVSGELHHTSDANYFSVSFWRPDADGNGFAVYHRRGLAPVLEGIGRVTDLASDGSTIVALLHDIPGCDFGLTLAGTDREPACLDQTFEASLSPDGRMLAIHHRASSSGNSSGERTTVERVETFDLLSGEREAVFTAPSQIDARSGAQVFLLWSDDGTQLAIYWPWVYGD